MTPPVLSGTTKNPSQRYGKIFETSKIKHYPRYHSNCAPQGAPLVGLQQALCLHAAVTGRVYLPRRPRGSSFQLRSYKPAGLSLWLAPAATSLKDAPRRPLRHRFSSYSTVLMMLPHLSRQVKCKFFAHRGKSFPAKAPLRRRSPGKNRCAPQKELHFPKLYYIISPYCYSNI